MQLDMAKREYLVRNFVDEMKKAPEHKQLGVDQRALWLQAIRFTFLHLPDLPHKEFEKEIAEEKVPFLKFSFDWTVPGINHKVSLTREFKRDSLGAVKA